jgi:hypothetical protein
MTNVKLLVEKMHVGSVILGIYIPPPLSFYSLAWSN